MKLLLPKTYLLFLCIIIFSCDQEKKEPEKSKYEIQEEKQNKLDTLNFNEAKKLYTVSNAIIGWDTIKRYTYELQELLENNARPISFNGQIRNIIKKDSLYILKVPSHSHGKDYLAEISVSTDMFETLRNQLDKHGINKGCFIFQVTRVTSSDIINFQGKLLSYYLYNKLNEGDE